MDTTHDLEIALRNAMDAHAKWRLRLKTAVATRRSDITPEHAACDNRCDFGKWLHDPHLDREIRDSVPYRVIRRLHAEFHRTDSEALESALNGQERWRDTVALQRFEGSSDKLNKALLKWLSDLRGY